LVLAGGTASAAAGTNPVIHACAAKSDGSLRVVQQTCHANEKPISWNAHGATGPAGPQGPQGPRGAPGPKGPKGDSGAADLKATSVAANITVPAGKIVLQAFQCPAGSIAVAPG